MQGIINSVDRGSPADRAGIIPGDTLEAIGGNRIIDVLDYKFYSYDPKISVTIKRISGKLEDIIIRKREGEDLGLNFETYLMDTPRHCANKCIFCFIDQLPKNLRETLYFKDDDARLSFLLGNYITLTNLSQREADRIIALRISPVNISVQTTNPELRNFMLGNKRAGESLKIMRRFYEAGIVMNCQIVLVPGVNDGAELTRTMADLKAMYPSVKSVSVVPVGITKHREGLHPLVPVDREKALEVIKQVKSFGEDCLRDHGTRLFFLADEFFLKAGQNIPEDDYYEDYPQLENGVGMLRLFQVEFKGCLATLGADEGSKEPFSIATGMAAGPFIQKLVDLAHAKCNNIHCKVYPIVNNFFGDTVDVAGLVTGGDIISQLKGKPLGERLLIPSNMLRHGGDVFLDDVSLKEVSESLGVPVIPVEQDGFEFCEKLINV